MFADGQPEAPPASSKSIARTSTSSSTRSGRIATVQRGITIDVEHDLDLVISLVLYLSFNDSGNSLKNRRTLGGRQCFKTSNWQNTQPNLFDSQKNITNVKRFKYIPSPRSASALVTKSFVFHLPSPYDWLRIRVNDRPDTVCNILPSVPFDREKTPGVISEAQ